MQGRQRGRSDLRTSVPPSPRQPRPRRSQLVRKRKAAPQERTQRCLSAFGSQGRRGCGLRPAGAGTALPGAVNHWRPGPPPNGPERRGSADARRGRGRADCCGQSGAGPSPAASPCRRPGDPGVPASPARPRETPGGPPQRRSRVPPRRAPRGCRAENGTPPYLAAAGPCRRAGAREAGRLRVARPLVGIRLAPLPARARRPGPAPVTATAPGNRRAAFPGPRARERREDGRCCGVLAARARPWGTARALPARRAAPAPLRRARALLAEQSAARDVNQCRRVALLPASAPGERRDVRAHLNVSSYRRFKTLPESSKENAPSGLLAQRWSSNTLRSPHGLTPERADTTARYGNYATELREITTNFL